MNVPEPPLPEQAAFIRRDPENHALLVAGAGTGKTWTLERRAAFLVEDADVPPEGLSVVTLTRAMARSLAGRIPYAKSQTLHSFALWQLNRVKDHWGRRVVDPWEVTNLVRQDLQLGYAQAFGFPLGLRDIDRYLRNLGAGFREEQTGQRELTPLEARLSQVLRHQQRLFRSCLMAELVDELVRVLEHDADSFSAPSHILVDEYQDLTPGELRLIQLLAERFGTVVNACGDDRQSIYGFREADPLALHRFPRVYALQSVDYLWHSKRCPKEVCVFAEHVERLLPPLPGIERQPLRPWANREDAGEVRVILAPSPLGEARWVVRQAQLWLDRGGATSDLMIIVAGFFDQVFPNLLKAAEECGDERLSFYDPRRVNPLSSDPAVRLLSAGARLLVDDNDQMAWRTLVWATPQLAQARLGRLLSAGRDTYVASLAEVAESDSICAKPLAAGRTLVEEYRGAVAIDGEGIVSHLAEGIGLDDLDRSGLEHLLAESGQEHTAQEWVEYIFDISSGLELEERADIPVHTVFQAKGLESRIVFVMNAIDESFVGFGNVADGIRRLYVAATRAQEMLIISAPRNLRGSSLAHAVDRDRGGMALMISDVIDSAGLTAQSSEEVDL